MPDKNYRRQRGRVCFTSNRTSSHGWMKLRLMLYLNKMAEVLEAATIVVSGKAPSFAETTAPRLPSILIPSPKHNEKRSVSGQLAVGRCHTRAYRGIRYTKFVTVT